MDRRGGNMEIILIRIEPGVGEIKRYEVFDGKEPKGFVFQWMTRLNLANETSRVRVDGKTRPFWSYVTPDGLAHYRAKLKTRKEAIKRLL